jgi:hypothetical protein
MSDVVKSILPLTICGGVLIGSGVGVAVGVAVVVAVAVAIGEALGVVEGVGVACPSFSPAMTGKKAKTSFGSEADPMRITENSAAAKNKSN